MNSSRTTADEHSTTSAEDDIRATADQYHERLEALLDGDPSSYMELWSHEDDVTTMHPSGGREEGWDAVSGTLQGFAAAMTDGTTTREDHVVRVTGDLAYELYNQTMSATFGGEPISLEGRVTNIYRKENDEWKVVHHHADFDTELAELVTNMSA